MRASTPSFVLTIPLHVEIWQQHLLDKRFNAGRLIYNDVLNEMMKRIRRMRQALAYREIQRERKEKSTIETLPDGTTKRKYPKLTPAQKKIMNELTKNYGINEFSAIKYTTIAYQVYKHLIDASVAQKIARRVWSAVDKYLYGNGKEVRFKKRGELRSVETNEAESCLSLKDGVIKWHNRNWKTVKPLLLKPIFSTKDTYLYEALKHPLKFVRLLREERKGKVYFYAQLTLEGYPPVKRNRETGFEKYELGKGEVGIDIGTQTIAIVSDKQVQLTELATTIDNAEREKRRLLRKMDRSRRANNPDKYHENGTAKKTNTQWVQSKSYLQTKQRLQTINRLIRIQRKQSHQQRVNRLLSWGNVFKVEQMAFQQLQKRAKQTIINEKTGKIKRKKRYGKSIGNKAPAMFIQLLKQKVERRGGQVHELPTRDMRASQYNHIADDYQKKSIGHRWAELTETITIQRDLYSAFLIRHWDVQKQSYQKRNIKKTFEVFRKLHQQEMLRVIHEEKALQSFGGNKIVS